MEVMECSFAGSSGLCTDWGSYSESDGEGPGSSHNHSDILQSKKQNPLCPAFAFFFFKVCFLYNWSNGSWCVVTLTRFQHLCQERKLL